MYTADRLYKAANRSARMQDHTRFNAWVQVLLSTYIHAYIYIYIYTTMLRCRAALPYAEPKAAPCTILGAPRHSVPLCFREGSSIPVCVRGVHHTCIYMCGGSISEISSEAYDCLDVRQVTPGGLLSHM